jgi:hypothetical protein
MIKKYPDQGVLLKVEDTSLFISVNATFQKCPSQTVWLFTSLNEVINHDKTIKYSAK